MKRVLAFVLSCVLLLTSCGHSPSQETSSTAVPTPAESESISEISPVPAETEPSPDMSESPIVPEYPSLNDPDLLRYVEDNIYQELVTSLNSSDYFVENVNAIYVSKEYFEELSYNSKENIFFGYTLSELDEQFQGTRYVFTLGDGGETTVVPFEENADPYEQILKNVAIGSGVILVCITVSTATAGLGAPAVSMIFSMSAKVGTSAALSSGAFGGISSGILTGVQTGNFDSAIEAAALGASEGFKWGAISGAIGGGVSEAIALKGATLNGLTINEAAKIQQESHYPLDVIAQMHSMDEYQVYQNAGLKPYLVNGKTALLQNIDLDYTSELPDGSIVTNLERMQRGYAPIEPQTGNAYQLHHIGQRADATLAMLNGNDHQGNASILNIIGKESEIDRPDFSNVRKEFWAFAGNVIYANGSI